MFGRQAVGVGAGVDLPAQHVGDPPGAVGPRSAEGYWLRHAATLTRQGAVSGAPERGSERPGGLLRRARFGFHQR
ncbi:hypothetical protein MPRM_19720 [Mycobacterium parmense]|uniref:Uncharacterized protein n=1 Tax=Mycobacterium parmense TaxID=185642 RepID=A0A7I7YVC6_9MYCO|nr:hypothetical protein MPRM_19720 [Mycobacterium parmense]